MYVKNGVTYGINEGEKFCKAIIINIKGKENLLLTGVYRSPNSSNENSGKLIDLLQKLRKIEQSTK